MTRTTRELLATLAQVNREVPAVALAIMDESLPASGQIAFGRRLVELGHAVQQHAYTERAEVIDHQPDPAAALPQGGKSSEATP